MPSNASKIYGDFIDRVRKDVRSKRYPVNRGDYRKFFLDHLQTENAELMRHLSFISDTSGKTLYDADVDHIVPRSIWYLLMPTDLCLNLFDSVLTNLKIRDRFSNRTNDQHLIKAVKKLQKNGKLTSEAKQQYIEIFLELKDYEVEGMPWTYHSFSNLNRRQSKICNRLLAWILKGIWWILRGDSVRASQGYGFLKTRNRQGFRATAFVLN